MKEYKEKVPLRTGYAVFKRIIAQSYFLIAAVLFIVPFFSPQILNKIGISFQLETDPLYTAILVAYFPIFGIYVYLKRKTIFKK